LLTCLVAMASTVAWIWLVGMSGVKRMTFEPKGEGLDAGVCAGATAARTPAARRMDGMRRAAGRLAIGRLRGGWITRTTPKGRRMRCADQGRRGDFGLSTRIRWTIALRCRVLLW